jgi:DNA end-binding protein Ku
MARAIWKGVLKLGGQSLAVKLYSAVDDRVVHFRLLHASDSEPVEQRIVRKADGKEVPADERRKAFPLDDDTLVILQPDELEALEPKESRDIELLRFVPRQRLTDQWFDKPYLVGPDGDEAGYFALAAALERSGRAGIARWAMREKRHVGALMAANGYLFVNTLHRAEQILTLDAGDLPAAKQPNDNEIRLAEQLVASVAGDFDPFAWRDQHHERVCELIEAKAKGRKVAARASKRKAETSDLAAALQKSLAAGAKEKRGA